MTISRIFFVAVLSLLALALPIAAQTVGPISITSNQCAQIGVSPFAAVVGIQVVGTWTGTLQPKGTIQGQTAFNIQVTPSTSSTAQATVTANGGFFALVAGYSTLSLCGNTVATGTATIYLNGSQAPGPAASSGGSVSFPLLAPNGTCTAPSYSFTSESGTGVVAVPNALFLCVEGSKQAQLDSSGILAVDGIVQDSFFAQDTNGAGLSLATGATTDVSLISSSGNQQVFLNTSTNSAGLIGGAGGQFALTLGVGSAFDLASSGAAEIRGTSDGTTVSYGGISNFSGLLNANAGADATTYATASNCSSTGTAANPSVASCGSAAAGVFSCATNAGTGTGTCQVNTTAVTANSQIIIEESADPADATRIGGGITCNTAPSVFPGILLKSRVAGTSFTINAPTFITNPVCFEYFIVN